MSTDDLYGLFEDCHRKGAERFGVDWLSANIAAKSAAEHMDIDPSTLEMKTLLSLASYRFLAWMYSDQKGGE
jgi:hypothetical protein